ncbi:MAG: protein phosphatase 2C domain-containing protein, partial [Nitrospinae bacterium]|nr:protein phosphatase 2C domain-containing protein [Nitrospinota bacterium]
MAERMSTNRTTNQIVVFGLSDQGLQRQNNEDHFMVADLTRKVVGVQDNQLQPELLHHTIGTHGTILVVADGVGGYEGGELASQLAVDTVAQALIDTAEQDLSVRARLVRAVGAAHEEIRRCHGAEEQTHHMASTLTAVHVGHGVMTIAQVGDSRAYRFRAGTLTLLTEDQSVVQLMQKKGMLTPEEAQHHPQRNIILQALGQDKPVMPAVQTLTCQHDDCLLLCSDGLSSYVAHEQIEAIMASGEDEFTRCRRLVEAANAAGGADNVTVLLARLIIKDDAHPEGADAPRESLAARATVTMRSPWPTEDATLSPTVPANETVKRPIWKRKIRWPWRHKATGQSAPQTAEPAAESLQPPAPLTPPEAPPRTQAKPHKAAGTASWDPEVLKAVEDSLAKRVGPVAKILVGRAASRTQDLHELCQA